MVPGTKTFCSRDWEIRNGDRPYRMQLENVLYEISAQRAVLAKTGADSSVVIVGYDQYNTWLLDPATGEVSPSE